MPSSPSAEIQLWAFPAESESNFNSDSRSSLQKKDCDDDDRDEHLERELQRYQAAFAKYDSLRTMHFDRSLLVDAVRVRVQS